MKPQFEKYETIAFDRELKTRIRIAERQDQKKLPKKENLKFFYEINYVLNSIYSRT